ncbi:MAG: PDZ domain-containing protein [Candidatus Riflebacteria bacterium]|nr:PDZ domain-containing protein [Candidatus Riflebacteria bacterium]
MASGNGSNGIDTNLVIGLVVFLICFTILLSFWDLHHEKELARSIEHHKTMALLHPALPAEEAQKVREQQLNAMAQFTPQLIQQKMPMQMVNDPSQNWDPQPWWGIQAISVTSENRKSFASPVPFGALITQITSNSVLRGLLPGDIIVKVDGKLLKDEPMFWALVKDKVKGSRLDLNIFRFGKLYALHFDP